jgi:transcriptional regulator with XRE-family HTH domain
VTRNLQEVREGLGIGLRQFARDAGVSASTLQGTENGRPLRPATALKYAKALQKRGADPNEVTEIRDVLGEVFIVDPDPYWKLQRHAISGLRENLAGLVRTGNEEAVRRLLEEVVAEYGDEGRKAREEAEAEYQQVVDENQEVGR